jgi:hypothetical protein
MPPRGGTKWLSTGLWAPAGQAITVTIPSTVAATLLANGGKLGVQVGSHSDNLSGKASWCRYGQIMPADVMAACLCSAVITTS